MPQTIQNDLGEDVEVFTADEVAAKEAEIKAAGETEKATLQAELDKMKGTEHNFGELRKQKDAAEKKAADLEAGIDGKIDNAKKEILGSVLKDHFTDTMKALVGDDEELRKKVQLNYDRIVDPAATKDEVAKKLRDAYVLSTASEDAGALNTTVLSSGGVGRPAFRGNDGKFTSEEQAAGAKFGLTKEDFEKHGAKPQ